jgi:hypothetical protein
VVNKWLTFSKAGLSNDEPKGWSDGAAGTVRGKGSKHLANATPQLLARSVLSELLAVRPVVDPLARGRDPRVAYYGHYVAMPARLGAQYAKTILCIVIGHPLNKGAFPGWKTPAARPFGNSTRSVPWYAA